jgi:hypothetical protein
MFVNTEPALKTESVRTKSDLRMRILLADTDRRPYTARLAMAFTGVGCDVSAVCTNHHPIETTKVHDRLFPYSAVRPKESLLSAIQSIKPDLIVPCDDRAVVHLQELCGQRGLDSSVVRVIEHSLGPSGSYAVVSARYPLLELAREQGIRVPTTQYLQTEQDLKEWGTKQPLPWVLKADGTWGGGGVKLAETASQVDSLLLTLGQPCKLKRALKRLLVNRDPFYLRDWWQGNSRPVIAQAYIAGRPANCAVACWEGTVLAQTNVEVLATSDPTGPAKVVRLVDNPEMTRAAERIAEKLQLSGFFGLDFIIENESGATYLIEMNPRCTPLSHVQIGSETGLVAALHAALTGQLLPATASSQSTQTDSQMIAYFPQAHDLKGEFRESSFYDYPHGEPELAKALLRPFPQQTLLYRIVDYLSSH